jgi:phosphosulfolactate phosphohydrolase-like enzyme
LARTTYHVGRNQYKKFLANSSHFQRLMGFNAEKDIDFCLQTNYYKVLPILQGNEIIKK